MTTDSGPRNVIVIDDSDADDFIIGDGGDFMARGGSDEDPTASDEDLITPGDSDEDLADDGNEQIWSAGSASNDIKNAGSTPLFRVNEGGVFEVTEFVRREKVKPRLAPPAPMEVTQRILDREVVNILKVVSKRKRNQACPQAFTKRGELRKGYKHIESLVTLPKSERNQKNRPVTNKPLVSDKAILEGPAVRMGWAECIPDSRRIIFSFTRASSAPPASEKNGMWVRAANAAAAWSSPPQNKMLKQPPHHQQRCGVKDGFYKFLRKIPSGEPPEMPLQYRSSRSTANDTQFTWRFVYYRHEKEITGKYYSIDFKDLEWL
ncbi:hypothetical protein ABW19_dt0204693 [Dactylella cylindrospora]|nr:hypothetical protein ABW19_dt0204693 [Dactylella cylindrospora]